MSIDYFFVSMLILAGVLTVFAMMRPEVLLRLCASLTWLALAFWSLLGGALDITKGWVIILTTVFVVMTFVPLIFQMNTEIIREKRGKSWREWGRRPKHDDYEPSPYEQHRQNIRDRINRVL